MKVFMSAYGGGHVTIAIPLARELKKRGYTPIILGFSVAIPALEKSGLEYLTVKDYFHLYSPEEQCEILKLGIVLADQYHNSESGLSYSDTVYYYGVSMFSLQKECPKPLAMKKLQEEGRIAFCPVDFMSRVLQYEHPDIVVNTCWVRMEKATLIAAKNMSIPSLIVLDNQRLIDYADYMNYISVSNDYLRKIHIEQGFEKDKVVALGQPAFDSLFSLDLSKGNILKDIGFEESDTRKTILWIGDGCEWTNDAFKEIEKAVIALPEYNFILKLHPASNDISDYILEGTNVHTIKNYNVQHLLWIADLVVGQKSTCIQQAMILKKKIILIYPLSGENIPILYDMDSALYIKQKDQLSLKIKEVIDDDSSEDMYLQGRSKYDVLPNGAKRIVDYIETIV